MTVTYQSHLALKVQHHMVSEVRFFQDYKAGVSLCPEKVFLGVNAESQIDKPMLMSKTVPYDSFRHTSHPLIDSDQSCGPVYVWPMRLDSEVEFSSEH